MHLYRFSCLVSVTLAVAVFYPGCTTPLTPEQKEIVERLNQREVPAWYDEAKFGIFIHWGPYAIPAFAPTEGTINDALKNHYDDFLLHLPYVEWYWNALQSPDSATRAFHAANYGVDYPYDNFGRSFREEVRQWDPQAWADLFFAAGARYVVLVTKHHDGFLMWPSAHMNPNKQDWYSERDIVGELAGAVRDRGMRFGVYYSAGLDWAYHARSARTLVEAGAAVPISPAYRQYAEEHFRELIERYAPSVLWNDIAYPANTGLWEMQRDYYEAVPDGVVNDRFAVLGPTVLWLQIPVIRNLFHELLGTLIDAGGGGLAVLQELPPPHYDFHTLEYATMDEIQEEKSEVTRGMGLGFGYNRYEPESVFMTREELIRSFVDIVSKNGNLLLNVGPKSNGDIPDIQAARLRELGAWLHVNGEAIYNTRPWTRAEGQTGSGEQVRFTQSHDTLFAVVLNDLNGRWVRLLDVKPDSLKSVDLLGYGPVIWCQVGKDLLVALPKAVDFKVAYTLALRR